MTSRDLSLAEFSHLAPAPQLLSAPARGDSAPPPLVIAGGGAVVAVVTPPRLQEKVMVALTAARAARVQALEVSRWADGAGTLDTGATVCRVLVLVPTLTHLSYKY